MKDQRLKSLQTWYCGLPSAQLQKYILTPPKLRENYLSQTNLKAPHCLLHNQDSLQNFRRSVETLAPLL